MKTDLLDYHLPEHLIAQTPPAQRVQSRLLALNRRDGSMLDSQFSELPAFLRAGDCLVVNDTKVLPARFYLQKTTGARIEGLYVSSEADGAWRAMLKNARRLKEGDSVWILDRRGQRTFQATIRQRLQEGMWLLEAPDGRPANEILDIVGFAALPPYIKRAAGDQRLSDDLLRYQTVYARQFGAVAAPTAGLHFDQPLLEKIQQMGVAVAAITLHVGLGTFKPIVADTLQEHTMHSEWYAISPQAAQTINAAAAGGGRIIAVGTTSVRTLETAAQRRSVAAGSGTTNLFIMPGFRFQMVDAMITNFHLPRSTLLALVAAFAGLDTIKKAYQHAIEKNYRFYSYGDAMLIY